MTLAEQVLPENERALGHARVDLVWSVAPADHSRLTTRARAAVSWSIGVQQQDRSALLPQFICGPDAKHSRAHNSNVIEHENNCNLYDCIIRLYLCNLWPFVFGGKVKHAFPGFDLMCLLRGQCSARSHRAQLR